MFFVKGAAFPDRGARFSKKLAVLLIHRSLRRLATELKLFSHLGEGGKCSEKGVHPCPLLTLPLMAIQTNRHDQRYVTQLSTTTG